MKNIKNRQEFLNEDLKKLDKVEYEAIHDMIENYLDENKIGVSFDDGYYNHDGEKDLNGLKEYLDANSSVNNVLDYFFNKYRDTIYSDDDFIAKNGFYDYMLYTYDNSFMLNGSGVGPEPDDKLMKYFYGFQTTKLGRLFILQNFNSFENFYRVCANEFPAYFFDTLSSIRYDYEDEFIVSSNNDYSTCIINISGLDKEKIIKEFEDTNEGKSSYIIIDDVFIVVFGKIVNMKEELNRLKKDIEIVRIKKQAKKYNL